MSIDNVMVHIEPSARDDLETLVDDTDWLRMELLALDVRNVTRLADDNVPDNAKGVMEMAGWLAIHLLNPDGIRVVIATVRDWAARTNRTIEISIGSDSLRLTRVSAEQQELIIDAWISRQAARA